MLPACFYTLGRPLDIIVQDAFAFYNGYAVYKQYQCIALAADEGKGIAKALDSKKAAL
jgi:hypothetical protein